MKTNFTDITIVLDRSGSMETVRKDTIGGFNSFVEAQRKIPGDCNVSLVQFDDQYEPLYTGRKVSEAPLLTTETFVPRGVTALLDAIGKTIIATGARLSAMPEADRPEKVLFVIVTDGGENASREFTRAKVFEMIGHQKAAYKWDFVFIGANQDAISVGASLNIAAGSSITYAANAQGTQAAFVSASNYAASTRTVGVAAFSDDDRKAQSAAGVR